MLIAEGLDGPICNLEGASTPYWDVFPDDYHSVYYHAVHQLTSNAEVTYGGNTSLVLFDLDIDDITGDVIQDYFNYEHWWDGATGDRADSLLVAMTNQATLLTDHYCVGRYNIGTNEKPVLCYEFKSNPGSPSVYQIRPVGIETAPISNNTLDEMATGIRINDGITTAVFAPNTPHLLHYSMCNSTPSDYWCTGFPPTVSLSYTDGTRYVEWFVEVPSVCDEVDAITETITLGSNPVSRDEIIYVRSVGDLREGIHQVAVYDMNGRVILSTRLEALNGILAVSSEELVPGVYFLVVDNDTDFSAKFTIF